MAILKFVSHSDSGAYEFLPAAGTVPPEDPAFIEFRKNFYEYQYKFISRAEKTEENAERLELYKSLAMGDCDIGLYGIAFSNDTYMRKFSLSLTIDFKMSPQQSLRLLDKSCNELKEQIKSMYVIYATHLNNYITDYPKNASGTKCVDLKLFERWKNAIFAYDSFEINKDKKIEISSEMGFLARMEKHHAVEEVTRYINYAKRLIRAASEGRLFEEASKPMTLHKKRNTKNM